METFEWSARFSNGVAPMPMHVPFRSKIKIPNNADFLPFRDVIKQPFMHTFKIVLFFYL